MSTNKIDFDVMRHISAVTSRPSRGRAETGQRKANVGRATGAIVLSLALSACSLAPKFETPNMAIPAGWSDAQNAALQSQQDGGPFWQALGSQELNHLIDRALAQNLDLEAALHRVEQARAQAKVT